MFLGVLFAIFLVLCLLVNLVKLNNPYFETSPSAIFYKLCHFYFRHSTAFKFIIIVKD